MDSKLFDLFTILPFAKNTFSLFLAIGLRLIRTIGTEVKMRPSLSGIETATTVGKKV